MVTVYCPQCGSFVDEVYDDELPVEMDCEVCGHTFLEDKDDDEDFDYGSV